MKSCLSFALSIFFIFSLSSCGQKTKANENSFKETNVSDSARKGDNEIGLYKVEVQRTVRTQKEKIFKCFTDAMPDLPDKNGELVFHLVIQKTKPVKVTILRKEDWMPETLAVCLQRVIQNLNFLPQVNFEKFELDYPVSIGKTSNQK